MSLLLLALTVVTGISAVAGYQILHAFWCCRSPADAGEQLWQEFCCCRRNCCGRSPAMQKPCCCSRPCLRSYCHWRPWCLNCCSCCCWHHCCLWHSSFLFLILNVSVRKLEWIIVNSGCTSKQKPGWLNGWKVQCVSVSRGAVFSRFVCVVVTHCTQFTARSWQSCSWVRCQHREWESLENWPHSDFFLLFSKPGTLFNTALSTTPHILLSRRMLGLSPGLTHWQSGALIIQYDLLHKLGLISSSRILPSLPEGWWKGRRRKKLYKNVS
jgi:hypothetical protein